MASITWVGRGDAELSIWRNYDVTMMHQSTYDLARRGWAVWCSQHHTHSCTRCAALCTLIMRTLCKIPLSRNSVKVWGNKHAFPALSSVAHYRLIKWNSAMLHSQDLMAHVGLAAALMLMMNSNLWQSSDDRPKVLLYHSLDLTQRSAQEGLARNDGHHMNYFP